MAKYSVIDIFAGAGGLAEGLSKVAGPDGDRVFQIALSIEKNSAAHSTLQLRSFLRQFGESYPNAYYKFLNDGGVEPPWNTLYPKQWFELLLVSWTGP